VALKSPEDREKKPETASATSRESKGQVMATNDYGTIVEKWKVQLIIARARKMGFRHDELEDLQQELVLHVMKFRFDPDDSRGATESTALTAMIDNQLRAIRRSRRRYQLQIEKLKARLESDQRRNRQSQNESGLLILDVRSVMGTLTKHQRQLCGLLAAGASLRDIATNLKCGRERAGQMKTKLKTRLQETGLITWIEG